MSDCKLDIAFWNYDRTRALADGTVRIEGVNASFHTGRVVTEIFRSMIRDRAYDVSELGHSYLLRTVDFNDPPFLAIPVFPTGASAIRQSTSTRPAALSGRRISPARPSVNSRFMAMTPG